MAKLTREQIMVGAKMVEKGVSVRQLARQLEASEGALRYQFQKRAGVEAPDGRSQQATSLDGFGERWR